MTRQPDPVAPDLAPDRERMLRLVGARVRDLRVLEAMAAVPREAYVPESLRAQAYDDNPLPVGEGQTISQPLIVALMLEALALSPDDHVLEVGTGSGYQAAVLSHLVRDVTSVERISSLREGAVQALAALNIANVAVQPAGDVLGWPGGAAFDAIVVAAGAPHVPRALIDQLRLGGRLVVPVGDLREQHLLRATKTAHGVELTRLGPCAFVPLIGNDAWRDTAVRDASISPSV